MPKSWRRLQPGQLRKAISRSHLSSEGWVRSAPGAQHVGTRWNQGGSPLQAGEEARHGCMVAAEFTLLADRWLLDGTHFQAWSSQCIIESAFNNALTIKQSVHYCFPLIFKAEIVGAPINRHPRYLEILARRFKRPFLGYIDTDGSN